MAFIIYSEINIEDQVSSETLIGLELFFEHTENWIYDITISFTDGSSHSDDGNEDTYQYTWSGGKKISSILVYNTNIDNAPPGPGVWPTDSFSIVQLCVKLCGSGSGSGSGGG